MEKLEEGWSRVYYSADSQLPSWVPGFAKDRLIGQALRQSTSWVDKYAQRAVGKGAAAAEGAPPFAALLRRLLVIVALVQAKAKLWPGLLPQIKLPPFVDELAGRLLPLARGLLGKLRLGPAAE